jgi:hypothetical protein
VAQEFSSGEYPVLLGSRVGFRSLCLDWERLVHYVVEGEVRSSPFPLRHDRGKMANSKQFPFSRLFFHKLSPVFFPQLCLSFLTVTNFLQSSLKVMHDRFRCGMSSDDGGGHNLEGFSCIISIAVPRRRLGMLLTPCHLKRLGSGSRSRTVLKTTFLDPIVVT